MTEQERATGARLVSDLGHQQQVQDAAHHGQGRYGQTDLQHLCGYGDSRAVRTHAVLDHRTLAPVDPREDYTEVHGEHDDGESLQGKN